MNFVFLSIRNVSCCFHDNQSDLLNDHFNVNSMLASNFGLVLHRLTQAKISLEQKHNFEIVTKIIAYLRIIDGTDSTKINRPGHSIRMY